MGESSSEAANCCRGRSSVTWITRARTASEAPILMSHPLLEPLIVAAIERAATEHRGQAWVCAGFTDLRSRAAHPCGILHGAPFSVFAKLNSGANSRAQFTAELAGLRLITELSSVATPTPVTTGLIETPDS